MISIPFSYRVLLLIALAVGMVAWDLARTAGRGSRWREYLFLFVCGMVGALLGMGNDLITSTISPEYFIFGKGIEAGGRFQENVLILGGQAGFSAGVILACVLLYANTPRRARPSLTWRRLIALTTVPLSGAVLGGVALGAAAAVINSRSMLDDLAELMNEQQLHRFAIAWAIHIGLYAGALVGLIVAVIRIRNGRRLAARTITQAGGERAMR